MPIGVRPFASPEYCLCEPATGIGIAPFLSDNILSLLGWCEVSEFMEGLCWCEECDGRPEPFAAGKGEAPFMLVCSTCADVGIAGVDVAQVGSRCVDYVWL